MQLPESLVGQRVYVQLDLLPLTPVVPNDRHHLAQLVAREIPKVLGQLPLLIKRHLPRCSLSWYLARLCRTPHPFVAKELSPRSGYQLVVIHLQKLRLHPLLDLGGCPLFLHKVTHSVPHNADVTPSLVVQPAVVKHKADVLQDLERRGVLLPFQSFRDRAEVHGLLHDLEVVWEVKDHRVHGSVEGPCLAVLHRLAQHRLDAVPDRRHALLSLRPGTPHVAPRALQKPATARGSAVVGLWRQIGDFHSHWRPQGEIPPAGGAGRWDWD
mmetsp:Transcript_16891/g.53539  ORF Transcript_16891/g.53539 Transcript_16891/m.53539 type:complete len:269 (-) Transcript_16891:500-1306(-)